MRQISVYSSEAVEQSVYPRIGLCIDGEWIYDRESCGDVRNPSTENVLGPVPGATAADLEHAIASAARGFLEWRDTPPRERMSTLLRAANVIRQRASDIAKVTTLENGKPLAQAVREIEWCANFIEWDAGQAMRDYGLVVPSAPRDQRLIVRYPIGPVVAFTPWNVPMSSAARKCGAALAAGCSVILKPARETPGTACEFVKCFDEAGLPKGVLNLVLGESGLISNALINSPVTRLITFTGSTHVGIKLTELAARQMKPVLMELGGHAPVIVSDTVDATAVGKTAAEAKARAAGQQCTSPSRFIVYQDVYDEFVSSFSAALEALNVGDGFDPNVDMGPVANPRRLAAVMALVEDARKRDARIATGGHRIGERGYYYEPTVLADLPLDSKVMAEEPFGPLAACVPVAGLDEALTIANSLPIGLGSYAFTNSLYEAERFAREIQAGFTSINNFGPPLGDTPFGGIKDSGLGREGGPSSLDAYTVTKTILQTTEPV